MKARLEIHVSLSAKRGYNVAIWVDGSYSKSLRSIPSPSVQNLDLTSLEKKLYNDCNVLYHYSSENKLN